MFLKQKIEVIPFKDFMSPAAASIQMKKPHTPILYSFVPGMTIEGFFDMTPQMAGLYALVLGVGGLAILSHIFETNFVKLGMHNVAYVIEKVTSILLPVGTYGFMLWVLFKII